MLRRIFGAFQWHVWRFASRVEHWSPPPQNVIFRRWLLPNQVVDIFQKDSIRMRWTSLDNFFKRRIHYNWYRSSTQIVPRLFMGCHAFLQKQTSQKLDPSWNCLCFDPFKVFPSARVQTDSYVKIYISKSWISNMQKLQWSKRHLIKNYLFLQLCMPNPFLDTRPHTLHVKYLDVGPGVT